MPPFAHEEEKEQIHMLACNPSYSGGRDQEDCSSKPAWTNNLQDPILRKPFSKKSLVEWLNV
jgi:hypothetical protein